MVGGGPATAYDVDELTRRVTSSMLVPTCLCLLATGERSCRLMALMLLCGVHGLGHHCSLSLAGVCGMEYPYWAIVHGLQCVVTVRSMCWRACKLDFADSSLCICFLPWRCNQAPVLACLATYSSSLTSFRRMDVSNASLGTTLCWSWIQ